MSFLNFLGEFAIFKMLFNLLSGKPKKNSQPVLQNYDRYHDADYYNRVEELNQQIRNSKNRIAEYNELSGSATDHIDELQARIDELESRLEDCDIMSDRYDRIQDKIDTLQDRIDEIEDNETMCDDMQDELDDIYDDLDDFEQDELDDFDQDELDDLYGGPVDFYDDDDW